MPIISKETWDNLIPEDEKKGIRYAYKAAQDKYNTSIAGTHSPAEYELLFGKENLQPQLTYEDVARELFLNKKSWYINTEGQIHDGFPNGNACFCQNMCTSQKQAEKLLAINKLLNVAKFLNKDWKPDWSDNEEKKFFPALIDNYIRIGYVMRDNSSPVYFRTEQLVQQAIQILGEDTVRLALTTEY